ncbi:MAG: M20/M25/M40 family metallo-hydrolase [Chloroflexi bacterium]|nr:M20/M25/M40 family metallo-hydrolase [Chloroflexota bacterium]
MKFKAMNDVLQHLDGDYNRRILADMIGIPSIIGNESKLANYIHRELTSIGIENQMVEIEPGRPNVYARIPGSRPGKRLHFNGHMDTVPVCEGWTLDPFTPTILGNRMVGLGASDMKAGLACIINMLRAFKLSGADFAGEISLSAVIDEEAYSKGTRAAMATDFAGCDAVVIAEAYSADETHAIPLGITGKILYEITVKGKAAHGFFPDKGINAIEESARILSALDRLNMRTHPNFGKGSLCTLKIEGGYQIYTVVVPDRCRFEINRMLVPGETSQMALQDMHELVRSLDLKAEVEIKLKPPVYESFIMQRNEPILQILDEVYPLVTGKKPHYAYTSVITDANVITGEHGIPCLHLGPPMGNIHQPDEYVLVDWLEPVSRMYAMIAERFLSEA